MNPHSIKVGTASWTDPGLIKSGRFYPKGCTSAEARLRFYASRFPIVEVNSSYYAMPNGSNSQLWAERTPGSFVLSVKAFRLMTGHQTPLDALPRTIKEQLAHHTKKNIYYKDLAPELLDELWAYFNGALDPLRHAGKLGTVHFQLAPWLTCRPDSIAHIEEVRRRLPNDTLSLEFRHESWFSDKHIASTLALERDLQMVHVVLDEPQGFSNSVGAHWEVTNERLAVVRLHGRNAVTWNIKGATAASERFNYDYSDDELSGLAASIQQLAQRVAQTYVIFNNNHEDQGQRNATRLMDILGLQPAFATPLVAGEQLSL